MATRRIFVTFAGADGADHVHAILIPFKRSTGFAADGADLIDAILIPHVRLTFRATQCVCLGCAGGAPRRCAGIATNRGDFVDAALVPRIAAIGGGTLCGFGDARRTPARSARIVTNGGDFVYAGCRPRTCCTVVAAQWGGFRGTCRVPASAAGPVTGCCRGSRACRVPFRRRTPVVGLTLRVDQIDASIGPRIAISVAAARHDGTNGRDAGIACRGEFRASQAIIMCARCRANRRITTLWIGRANGRDARLTTAHEGFPRGAIVV